MTPLESFGVDLRWAPLLKVPAKGRPEGSQACVGGSNEILVTVRAALIEPGQRGLYQPAKEALRVPGVKKFVTRVECCQSAHYGHRDRSKLGRVVSKPRLTSSMAPQEREAVGIPASHGQEGAWPQTAPTRFGQLAAELLTELLEDFLEDLAVELLL